MSNDISELPEHQFLWIFAFIIFIFTIIFLKGIIDTHASKNLDVSELEHFLLTQRAVYDKNCLAYEDIRNNPGTVDLEKFNEDRLSKCIDIKGQQIGMKFTLTLENETKEADINRDMTNRLVFCKKGGFRCFNDEEYVLVKEDGEINGGYLNIEIIEII